MLPAAGRFFKVVGRRKQFRRIQSRPKNGHHIEFTAQTGGFFKEGGGRNQSQKMPKPKTMKTRAIRTKRPVTRTILGMFFSLEFLPQPGVRVGQAAALVLLFRPKQLATQRQR
jgi:hypothetical protein